MRRDFLRSNSQMEALDRVRQLREKFEASLEDDEPGDAGEGGEEERESEEEEERGFFFLRNYK